MNLKAIGKKAYATAKAKGFHKDDSSLCAIDNGHVRLQLSWLAMIGSEVGEAVDAVREGNMENLSEELADIIIRVCDMAEVMGLNLDKAVIKKMSINQIRPNVHGGKLA